MSCSVAFLESTTRQDFTMTDEIKREDSVRMFVIHERWGDTIERDL